MCRGIWTLITTGKLEERPPCSWNLRRHIFKREFLRAHERSKGAEKILKMGLAGCEQNSTGAKPGSDKRRGEQIQDLDLSEVEARQVSVLEAVGNPSVRPKSAHLNSHSPGWCEVRKMEGIKIIQRPVPSHHVYEEPSTTRLMHGTIQSSRPYRTVNCTTPSELSSPP